jgi:hypothetical protein
MPVRLSLRSRSIQCLLRGHTPLPSHGTRIRDYGFDPAADVLRVSEQLVGEDLCRMSSFADRVRDPARAVDGSSDHTAREKSNALRNAAAMSRCGGRIKNESLNEPTEGSPNENHFRAKLLSLLVGVAGLEPAAR